jgi:hypothetical protein
MEIPGVLPFADRFVRDGCQVDRAGGLADAAFLVGDDVDFRAESFEALYAVTVVVSLAEVEGQGLAVAYAVGPPDGGALRIGGYDKDARHVLSRMLPGFRYFGFDLIMAGVIFPAVCDAPGSLPR